MTRRILLIVIVPILAVLAVATAAGALLQAANINPVAIVESVAGPIENSAQIEQILDYFRVPLRFASVLLAFIVAWIISRLSYRFAGWLLKMTHVAATPTSPEIEDVDVSDARRLTLQQLVASMISFAAFTTAAIFALSSFVSLTNLALLATVLANAFGFAARDYVGDILNGISNLFEDRFDIGENIEIVRVEDEVRGVVEQINIRTVGLRTRSGELVIVPQGQVRILRNYSRGAFTGTDVTVTVAATDLLPAMELLVALGQEAPALLEDLIEPWRVISREGEVTTTSELVISAKAAYGRGAQLRLEIMALVQQRLAQAGIALAG